MRRATLLAIGGGLWLAACAFGANPVITHMRTADPSCHVWADGKVWMYASQDQPDATSYDTMDGYHVFSSSNMVDWTDHGQAFHSSNVSWGIPGGGFMWAPDCAYKNGIYYFYYPHRQNNEVGNWRIGVATSSLPQGPFVDIGHYIEGTDNTDPSCFIDDDGEAYLYWSPNPYAGIPPRVAKLKPNMIELAETPRYIDYGANNCKEGLFMHKYKGVYYLSYTDWSDPVDQGFYAMGNSPYGPFTYKGAVNAAAPGAQDHHSMLEYKGQWYYFYHVGNYNGINQYRRNSCVDLMFYNPDGTIQKVKQTTTGVPPAGTLPGNWSAWNDCAWLANDVTGLFTTNHPLGPFSQYLINTSNQYSLPVEIAFATNAATSLNLNTYTITVPPATDAAQWFSGKVGANNAVAWGRGSLAMTLSGLDTGKFYNIVLWSTRGADSASYSNRFTEFTLSGATAFANLSSAGADKSTASMPDDVTRVRSALSPGRVARYDGVSPGSDGAIMITMTAGSDLLWPAAGATTNGYLNAFAIMTSTNVAAPANTNTVPPQTNAPAWQAYNDIGWITGELTSNITQFTPVGGTASGSLVDSVTGQPLPVQASLTCDTTATFYPNAANLNVGTPAGQIFGGKVSLDGYVSYGSGTMTLTLTNLEPARKYSLAMFGSRGLTNYTTRWTDVRILGADAFINNSSPGATVSTVGMANDQTRILAANTEGLVWRYDAIQPGADGTVSFTATAGGATTISAYLNAFTLRTWDDLVVPDSWKTNYFGPTGTNVNLAADADGDGLSNEQEYIAGTSPTDVASQPQFARTRQVNGAVCFDIQTATQRVYQVDYKTNLTSGVWLPYATISGNGSTLTLTNSATDGARYYRFRVGL